KLTVVNSSLERLSTRRNRREWIIDLMDHARRESSDRREFFSTRDRAICFDAIGDFFAHRNYVRNLAAVVGPHRNLADHPVTNIAFWRRSFLLDALNFASFKNTRKLFFQHIARLAS